MSMLKIELGNLGHGIGPACRQRPRRHGLLPLPLHGLDASDKLCLQSNDLGDLGLDAKYLPSGTLSEVAELVARSKHNGTPKSWLLLDLTFTFVVPGIGQVEVEAGMVIQH